MGGRFSRYLQARAPNDGQTNSRSIGRSVLVVGSDSPQRRRWARAVGILGFRPLLADTPSEGRRLLSSLVVRAAIVERTTTCGAFERSCSSLLLVALGSIPTLVVTEISLSDDDVARESQQLLAAAASHGLLDMVPISQFRLRKYVSDPTIHN